MKVTLLDYGAGNVASVERALHVSALSRSVPVRLNALPKPKPCFSPASATTPR